MRMRTANLEPGHHVRRYGKHWRRSLSAYLETGVKSRTTIEVRSYCSADNAIHDNQQQAAPYTTAPQLGATGSGLTECSEIYRPQACLLWPLRRKQPPAEDRE